MDYRYSLYDALVSINVPSDKARAVVDAMEREMGTTLATKQDQTFETLELRLFVKPGSLMAAGFGLTIAAMRLWS